MTCYRDCSRLEKTATLGTARRGSFASYEPFVDVELRRWNVCIDTAKLFGGTCFLAVHNLHQISKQDFAATNKVWRSLGLSHFIF